MSFIRANEFGAMMITPTSGYPMISGGAAWKHFAKMHDELQDPYYNPRDHLTMEQIPPADRAEVMQRFPPGTMFGAHSLPAALKANEFRPGQNHH
jgi:hypothetical protein